MGGESGKGAGGDYPILRSDQLPLRPSQHSLYDVIAGFMGAAKDAYNLGVAPPQSDSPEDVWAWRAKVSPLLEDKLTGQAAPAKLFKGKKTVGI